MKCDHLKLLITLLHHNTSEKMISEVEPWGIDVFSSPGQNQELGITPVVVGQVGCDDLALTIRTDSSSSCKQF